MQILNGWAHTQDDPLFYFSQRRVEELKNNRQIDYFFSWKTMLFLLGWNCYNWNAYIHVKYFFHFNLWHIFGIVVSNKVVKLTILSFPSWTLIVLILNRMIPDSSSVGVELSETRSSTWQAFYVKVIGLVLRGNTMMEMLPFKYTNWIM